MRLLVRSLFAAVACCRLLSVLLLFAAVTPAPAQTGPVVVIRDAETLLRTSANPLFRAAGSPLAWRASSFSATTP